MAVFRPFHALMPRPAEAAQVAAVPYDVVNTTEAAKLAGDNPLTFLRVSRPEIELPAGTDIHSDAVYDKALANFKRLCAACFFRNSLIFSTLLPPPVFAWSLTIR